jgi:hypothetical protein
MFNLCLPYHRNFSGVTFINIDFYFNDLIQGSLTGFSLIK